MTPPDKAEYDNQEFIADTDLIGMISKEQTCCNCKHYTKVYELCCYSLGDEDYDCHGREWELKE